MILLYMDILSRRIKEGRVAKGLTQKQLAEILNVKQNTLSQWENGIHEPPVEMIIRIAKALDCDANFLLGFSDF